MGPSLTVCLWVSRKEDPSVKGVIHFHLQSGVLEEKIALVVASLKKLAQSNRESFASMLRTEMVSLWYYLGCKRTCQKLEAFCV